MYGERPSRIPGCSLWWRRADPGDESLVLPDGCTDVIWLEDRLVVAGPDTGPQRYRAVTGQGVAGFRFAPGLGPHCLGVPGHELRDRRVELAELWPRRLVEELSDRFQGGGASPEVLDEALARRLDSLPAPDPRITGVVALLRSGCSVAGAARATNQSERHLRRLAAESFGYSAKTLQRILRFQRALSLARGGAPLALAAHRTGYADQAHMAREVRELAGTPMTTLLRS